MKRFNEFIKESLRDKMTPISEEELRKNMSDEKYYEFKKLLDVRETLSKRPFLPSDIGIDLEPMLLKVYSNFNTFNIRYERDNDRYTLATFDGDRYQLKNLKELIEKIKEISFHDLEKFIRQKNEEINKLQIDVEDAKEDFSYININY